VNLEVKSKLLQIN